MAITLKEQKRRTLESLTQNEEMDPKDHVTRHKDGTYCVYNNSGSIAKEFDNEKDANEYAIANHDNIMKEADAVDGYDKCWDGYRKKGTKPGTGKNTGKRVNNCVKEDRDYTAVHVKHGTRKVKGTSSYDAAKNAAKQFGAKDTKGIDVHLHTKEPQRMTEETPAEKLNRTRESNRQRANKIVTQQNTQREYRGEPVRKKPTTNQWADALGSDSVSTPGSFKNEQVAALLRPTVKQIKEGYYKNIDTNRKEDARLANSKPAQKKELPPHIQQLMKRIGKKNMPNGNFKTRDVTPKGYGPNEEVHPETYKAQNVYDNAHTDVTKKGHSEIEAHKHASGVMKKKHPGFSATRGEGQVYKESESLEEVSKKTLKSYIPKAANSLSHNAQGRAFNISANMTKDNKDMQKHYDQRMTVRMKGIHNATKQLTKEADDGIAQMIDKTNPGYAKKVAKVKAKIEKDYKTSNPASRYMSKRKDRLKSMVVKESSASDRIAKKLNDMASHKRFMDGETKIPDYSQRPRNKPYDLSKKVKTVKEAAKKAKDKQVKPETFQDEPTLNNNISKNDSN